MLTEFKNHLPFSRDGFGLFVNKYMNGRVSVAYSDRCGLQSISFYGEQPLPRPRFFRNDPTAGFGKLFRLQLLIDGIAWEPEFHEVRHYPFGYSAECELDGVRIRHELLLLPDTIVQRVAVLDNPARRSVAARILCHGHLTENHSDRTWQPLAFDASTGFAAATATDHLRLPSRHCDALTPVTDIAEQCAASCFLLGSTPIMTETVRHRPFKHYFVTAPSDTPAFFLTAATTPEKSARRATELRSTVHAECDRMLADYHRSLAEGPRFDGLAPVCESALRNVAPALSCLEIPDVPGAFRASQGYWVWGWDSMVHAEALIYAGAPEQVRSMLEFYRRTADREHGIAHMFTLRFQTAIAMTFSAQSLYVVTLYNYWSLTGDDAFARDAYPFARWIMEQCLKTVEPRTGLAVGIALFPDYPECLGATGKDLSLFNNSLFYQGLRALENLATLSGNNDDAEKFRLAAQRTKQGFEQYFLDPATGYWFDSLSSETLEIRPHHPLYGQLWVSPFAEELGRAHHAQAAQYLWDHFRFANGLYMVPPGEAAFMSDGNQIGAYYPVVDRYFWNMMNRSGRREAVEYLEHIVGFFWHSHTYPEGLTHETANAEPEIDNPGCKQAFAAKSFYCDFLELYFGLSADHEGIRLSPLPVARPLTVTPLRLRGKVLTLSLSGGGSRPEITVNGQPSAARLLWRDLPAESRIEIHMK